jgi:hypothetical protein
MMTLGPAWEKVETISSDVPDSRTTMVKDCQSGHLKRHPSLNFEEHRRASETKVRAAKAKAGFSFESFKSLCSNGTPLLPSYVYIMSGHLWLSEKLCKCRPRT